MAFITIVTPTAEGGSFLKKVGQYLKAHAARRKELGDYRRMLKLSNRDLRDMGVTRDQVREMMMRKVSWPGAL